MKNESELKRHQFTINILYCSNDDIEVKSIQTRMNYADAASGGVGMCTKQTNMHLVSHIKWHTLALLTERDSQVHANLIIGIPWNCPGNHRAGKKYINKISNISLFPRRKKTLNVSRELIDISDTAKIKIISFSPSNIRNKY